MKNKLLILSFLFLILLPLPGMATGTVIRNGGDPIFEFLMATRSSFVESLRHYLLNPEDRKNFCGANALTEPQQVFCRKFMESVAEQVLLMNQDTSKKTPFVLRKEFLEVVGPDGKNMIVAARTEVGPSGAIEFHRDSVKSMTPVQLLFLLMHEFGHKVSFEGRYVTDDAPLGPFMTGRELLDSVASALTQLARRYGKIGTQFGIRDIFECQAFVGSASFLARVSSSRLFLSEDLRSYEISLGKNPLDQTVSVIESLDSALVLRLQVREPNNCESAHSGRSTKLEILRRSKTPNGEQQSILVEKNYDLSPTCPHSDVPLIVETAQVRFECRYWGAEGTTASAYRFSRP